MKKSIWLGIFVLLIITSCKKLEQKDFYLDNNCEACQEMVEKDVVEVGGIYYAIYEPESGKLLVKYDPAEFKVAELYEYLQENAFTKPSDSLSNRYPQKPLCCGR